MVKWHSPAACLRSHEDWNLLGNPLGIDRGTGQQMTHGASNELGAAMNGSFYASILVLLSSCHVNTTRLYKVYIKIVRLVTINLIFAKYPITPPSSPS